MKIAIDNLRLPLSVLFVLTVCIGFAQDVIQIESIHHAKPLKRGKEYTIITSGGEVTDVFQLQLLKDNTIVWGINNLPNSGRHSIKLPTTVRPGKNYSFVILRNGQPISRYGGISIKRNIPLALKLSPFVLAGIAAFLISGDCASGSASEQPPSPFGG